MKKALMMASVSSMIDLFNMNNIQILQELGYEVEVACNFKQGSITSQERVDQFQEELTSQGIKYYHLDVPRNISALKDIKNSYRVMKKLCDQENYALVHCHSPVGGMIARLACRKARKKGTKLIYTAHGFHFFRGAPKKNWLLYYPVEKFLARFTDILITINEEDYSLAQKKKFKADQIFHVRGIGIDLKKFSPVSKEEKAALRDHYGYDQDDFIMIHVGELSYRKHQDLLIQAVAQVKDKIDQVKLLLIGHGSRMEEYRQLIKTLGLEDEVELLGYRGDVPQLMPLADVAVSASRQEGLAVNVMEAMASGLPLVISNSRGHGDLVVHQKNGILYELDDLKTMTRALVQLYQDRDLRQAYGQESLALIKNFSTDKVNAEMRKIYQDVMADYKAES